jgi:hypothetical protein
MERLTSESIVYRAMIDESWLRRSSSGSVTIKKDAFFRRNPEKGRDIKGISVNPADHCTIEDVKRRFSFGFYGVGELVVGDIRTLGLDVVPDSGKPSHANIIGLPHKWDEDAGERAKAHFYASELARIAIYKPLGVA